MQSKSFKMGIFDPLRWMKAEIFNNVDISGALFTFRLITAWDYLIVELFNDTNTLTLSLPIQYKLY